MKITKAALKQLIREELENSLEEAAVSPAAYARQLGGAEGAAAFEAGEGPQTYGGDHNAADAKFLKLMNVKTKEFMAFLDNLAQKSRSPKVQKKARILKSLMKKTIVGALATSPPPAPDVAPGPRTFTAPQPEDPTGPRPTGLRQ